MIFLTEICTLYEIMRVLHNNLIDLCPWFGDSKSLEVP